jgi:glycerophosphoryl diester phosphodiesterase
MDPWGPGHGPLLYAHRGAPLEHPENSLEGFAAALEAGADVLEIDVHMTRDGHVMVAHDAGGARTAGEPREIRACTRAEVARWDIGAGPGLSCARRGPVRMPSLGEVLEAFPRAALNVDVKQSLPDMLGALLRVVGQHAAAQRVLLTSFSSVTTRRIRALGYAGPVGLGRMEAVLAVFAPQRVLQRLRPPWRRLQVPLRAGPFRLDRRELVAKMTACGIATDYWVVNDELEAARLIALGAGGIVTDDPRRLAALFARSPHTGGWRARHGHDAP